MSKYTTEVRFICESSAGLTESAGGDSVENIITAAAPNVFNFPFPIFDENYRLPLERKILRHFYTREICEETVGLWKLRLCDRLNNIMPYYNKMYNSELLEFNPFHDVDLTRTLQRENRGSENSSSNASNEKNNSVSSAELQNNRSDTTNNGTARNIGTATQTENNTGWDMYSDTPQGDVTGITSDNFKYLTNARKKTENNTTTNNSDISTTTQEIGATIDTVSKQNQATGNERTSYTNQTANQITNIEEYTEHLVGKQGSENYSKLLENFRRTFLNIDMMIIDELEDLFFGLWA